MPTCTILSDTNVQEILLNQSKAETLDYLNVMRNCLADYSLTKEREYQPLSSSIVRPGGQKALWRPFTAPDSVGCKIIVDPAADDSGRKPPLHGMLVVTDSEGKQTGVINAAEVTGYRTAMATMIPFMQRQLVKRVIIFGAGKQALWHARLALALRGDEIENLTIINRSAGRGEALLKRLKAENAERWKSTTSFDALNPTNMDRGLPYALCWTDVILCTVPSTEPLLLAQQIDYQPQPLIAAIGSWQPNMIELDTDLIKHAVSDPQGQQVILVDDRVGCMDHAGEVVQSQLKPEQLVEIGSVYGTEDRQDAPKVSDEFKQWLRTGLVVYKSVGVSVMDLAAGQRLLALAKEKGLGTHVPDF